MKSSPREKNMAADVSEKMLLLLFIISFAALLLELAPISEAFKISRFLNMRTASVAQTDACDQSPEAPIYISASRLAPRLRGFAQYFIAKPDICLRLGHVKTIVVWDFPGLGRGERELETPATIEHISTYKLDEIPPTFFKYSNKNVRWKRAVRHARHKLNRRIRQNPNLKTEEMAANSERWNVVFYDLPYMTKSKFHSLVPERLSFAKSLNEQSLSELNRSGATHVSLENAQLNLEQLPQNRNSAVVFECSSKAKFCDFEFIGRAKSAGWSNLYWNPSMVVK